MFALLLMGCELLDEGADPRVVDDVQVIGVTIDPPEAAPGTTVTITPYIADPNEVGVDVLVWTCTRVGGVCLEVSLGVIPWAGEYVSPDVTNATLFIPPEADLLLDELVKASVPVYTLACARGLCPIIDRIRVAPPWPDPAWTGIYDELADPQALMRQLPFSGVYLGVRTFLLSYDQNPLTQNTNPNLVLDSFLVDMSPSASQLLQFSVGDGQGGAMQAYGFTTDGSITTVERVRFNQVDMTYTAPPVATSARIWVVVEEDVLNGSDVYAADVVVR